MNAWIKLTEKPPELFETVQVYGKDINGVRTAIYNPDREIWKNNTITHWQPLPEPPEDEDLDSISIQEYNEKIYPLLTKAECFVANLNHALDKSDDNAKMQCRVIGWDEEAQKLLRSLLQNYRKEIKKKVR